MIDQTGDAGAVVAMSGLNGKTHRKAATSFLAAELEVRQGAVKPRAVPTHKELELAEETVCTDHMITVAWTEADGWARPQLVPYGPLALMPTASVLHYATECFDGLKLYRGHDGLLRLFRPDRNALRMVASAARVALPVFDPCELVALLVALAAADGPRWLRAGQCLYLRPTMVGTNAQLGVQPARAALLYIIAAFVPRFDSPPGGLWLQTSPVGTTRAWPGGFGWAKVGANYGPSLPAAREAKLNGFHQVLWLFGEDGRCTEAGASNFCVVWRRRPAAGEVERMELVTAPLDDGLILNGVTRQSALQLVRERMKERVDVVERSYTIAELVVAANEGRLVEAFVLGTAYFVGPVSLIQHHQVNIQVPMTVDGVGGEIAMTIRKWLTDIMYGVEESDWVVKVAER